MVQSMRWALARSPKDVEMPASYLHFSPEVLKFYSADMVTPISATTRSFSKKRWGGWEVRLDAAEVKSKPSEELAPDKGSLVSALIYNHLVRSKEYRSPTWPVRITFKYALIINN